MRTTIICEICDKPEKDRHKSAKQCLQCGDRLNAVQLMLKKEGKDHSREASKQYLREQYANQ